jgi:tetratricopeptide (TPR) repeat protein
VSPVNRKERRAEAKNIRQAGIPAGVNLEQVYLEAIAHERAGRVAEALAGFEKAAALAPNLPQAHYNLGVAYSNHGRIADALNAFQRAVSLAPGFAEAQANLGAALTEQDRLEAAVAALRKSISLAPDNPPVHNNLGTALKKQGRLQEAAAAYREAIRLSPAYAEAMCNLAAVLRELRQFEEAAAYCHKAIETAPRLAKPYNTLGVVLQDQGKTEEAVSYFRQAIMLAPGETDAYLNLGDALAEQGQYDQPVIQCQKAAELAPDSADVQTHLGVALFHARRLDEAAACFRCAIMLRPERAEGHFDLGMALLAAGNMAEGWKEYEWRWRTPAMFAVRRNFAQAEWDGRATGTLAAGTLLIHAEQGLGDTLHFCRYAPLAAARGVKVILEVQPPLVRLLRSLQGIDTVMARGETLPAFDFQAHMLSLPYIFGTVLETIPGATPYLFADPADIEAMRVRLGQVRKTGLRVGLAWAGNSYANLPDMAAVDRRRSLAPEFLAPLFEIPEIDFISLQKGSKAPAAFGLTDFMDEMRDFADTAALVENLDLVISVDTSVAHLAGALGKPVWLLNRYDAEWRWLDGRTDSPWYPGMRLFRQAAPGDWAGVIAEVAAALRGIALA